MWLWIHTLYIYMHTYVIHTHKQTQMNTMKILIVYLWWRFDFFFFNTHAILSHISFRWDRWLSPTVTEERKAPLPLCNNVMHWWMEASEFANKLLYLLLGAIAPSFCLPDRHFLPIQSHLNSQFKESLLDSQSVPKSIGNNCEKKHILHMWWHHASLIP